MSPLLIAMTLLGCSDAGDQCHAVRVLPSRYATLAICNADAENILTRLAEADAPIMAVHCDAVAPTTIALAAR